MIDAAPQHRGVRDVGRHGDDGYVVGCQALGGLSQPGLLAGDQADGDALRRERLRDREPDALAATGD